MESLLFIINPIAGGGKAKELEAIILQKMNEHRIGFEIVFTSGPKDGINLAQNSKYETIVAVGGDGTINEVAKGIINRGYGVMGIIPGGTGNDMSKSLSIPLNPIVAIDIIIQRKIREIDIGEINSHKFLNVASAGFDGEVVNHTNSIKHKYKGMMAYILGVLKALITFKKKKVVIDIDNERYHRDIVLLAVGNGKYYGGGMMILPGAELDDGYLHICLVKNVSKLTLLGLFPTIFKGHHVKLKRYVELFKAKRVNIVSEEELVINFDGEIESHIREVEFKLSDERLRIIGN